MKVGIGGLKDDVYSNNPCTEDNLKGSFQNDMLWYDGMLVN
jgi:hypothetical protein